MPASVRPTQHPHRVMLHNEVHARPPEAMSAPLAIAHIVMLADAAEREASRAHVAELLRDHHLALPDADSTHLRMDLGSLRMRWELHTEFVSWTFMQPAAVDSLGEREPASAADAVAHDWLAALPGQCLCSLNLWVLPTHIFGSGALVKQLLNEDRLVASSVAGGHGEVYTDFAIHADGFSRMLLLAGGMTPRRLGRLVQRLLEIETYRMAALLGLPAAREAARALALAESELAALAQAIRSARRDDEAALLDRLTRLAGQVESQYAATQSRFSASSAYFGLLDRRIREIAESRLAGMQTIGEFMDRRLSPARSTCEWAARRQDALSQRVSRTSSLLRTRVEIEQQQSSQALLATMNQRQDLQLRMQSTVEGLSVAAITYYVVGLVSHLAKAAQPLGWPLSPESTVAGAIPVVAFGVWCALRRLHHRVLRRPD
ncbi:DUF3422 domain-containing protein [Verminephrobacter aporrectodeae subsp. tuberculatae]|uniref:DUF3422 domain-containing protein n=1 Tax=Verminephrobacter aporrectodeae subsp. tuberculatae TaxID=1110392 RepID=A0ABT3KSF7_9BURK|nr:DUF3422 domain-containing protein [Verminephrobacter aporrectodeae]MCW5256061.1 DUF3422 domain-containing protein [Verminephrobacter aporrectodeae subsp. tuberculatae]MCW5321067.1 DUF3422 domain-containing protein [Verminephrobacter aporrectodeae subsp. tuberculatae]MCW8166475.1 DUF3422 domain-containing protein [Verminephrobacter aporrectodeae subsp. tuberculatae]MCW8170696.1 DUF3422 domain-containing protein [Verminephrobacter aporrectodeae subsp. tuberculatae]MCW8200006.1 DUF3422 domain-